MGFGIDGAFEGPLGRGAAPVLSVQGEGGHDARYRKIGAAYVRLLTFCEVQWVDKPS